MANDQNLIPLDKRTKEEQRAIQSEGGKASGAARRRKRLLKDAVDYYLSLPVTDSKVFNKLVKHGVETDDIDNQMAMIVGLHARATLGDAKAAKVLVDILGEHSSTSDDEGVQIVDNL